MAEESTAGESDPQITFKVKTSADGNHTLTMAETATVLDLKTKLSGNDFENIPVERQRLIYSGRVMKNEEPLGTYKIKPGNTIHMVKSAQSNAAQNPANSAASPAAAVPTNMASGTANNPLAGLTGARYAGHMGLPGAEMFGADGGMGAPPTEDQMATLLEDPNTQAMITEAMNNPAMVDMMINSNPMLRDNPQAREMLRSPEFRRMMLDPAALRQAAQLRRMMGGGAGGAGAFPAPGVTDTTPSGAAGTNPTQNQTPFNPFAAMGPGAGINPFGQLFPTAGQTPAGTPPPPASAGQTSPPSAGAPANAANAANPFASLFGGAGAGTGAGAGAGANPFQMPGMPPLTPEMMQQAMQMARNGGLGDLFGAGGFPGGAGGFGAGGAPSSPAPADTRPPEERYAEQLRQLNDMGFFDFDRNVEALRRSGGSVQGAIEQLLSG